MSASANLPSGARVGATSVSTPAVGRILSATAEGEWRSRRAGPIFIVMAREPGSETWHEAEELHGEEWAEWCRLTPEERWIESERLWATFLALGGSLDPEPDPQSPFDVAFSRGQQPLDGRAGVRVVRRGGV